MKRLVAATIALVMITGTIHTAHATIQQEQYLLTGFGNFSLDNDMTALWISETGTVANQDLGPGISAANIQKAPTTPLTLPEETLVTIVSKENNADMGTSAGAFVSFPRAGAGTLFRLMSIGTVLPTRFLVIAIQNTVVSFTPSSRWSSSFPAGVEQQIPLDGGQYLSVEAADFNGMLLSSSSPILVTVGSSCAAFADSIGCDQAVTPVPPIQLWGTEYVVSPVVNQNQNPMVKLVAHSSDTAISAGGSPLVTLNQGQTWEGRLSPLTPLTGTKPFLMGQVMDEGSTTLGGQDLAALPPIHQWKNQHDFVAPTSLFQNNQAVVIAETGSTVALNGQTLNSWQVVGAYKTATVSLQGPIVSVTSSAPVLVSAQGFSEDSSYFFSAGQKFQPFETVIQPSPMPTTMAPTSVETSSTPSVDPTATSNTQQTSTPTPTATSASPEASPSATGDANATPTPTATLTPAPTTSATATVSATPSATATPAEQQSQTASPTQSAAPTQSAVPTQSAAPTQSATPTTSAVTSTPVVPPPVTVSSGSVVVSSPVVVTAPAPVAAALPELVKEIVAKKPTVVEVPKGKVVVTKPVVRVIPAMSLGFAAASSKLTSAQLASIKKKAATLKPGTLVTCIGYSGTGSSAAAVRNLALARAKAVCSAYGKSGRFATKVVFGGTLKGTSATTRKVIVRFQ